MDRPEHSGCGGGQGLSVPGLPPADPAGDTPPGGLARPSPACCPHPVWTERGTGTRVAGSAGHERHLEPSCSAPRPGAPGRASSSCTVCSARARTGRPSPRRSATRPGSLWSTCPTMAVRPGPTTSPIRRWPIRSPSCSSPRATASPTPWSVTRWAARSPWRWPCDTPRWSSASASSMCRRSRQLGSAISRRSSAECAPSTSRASPTANRRSAQLEPYVPEPGVRSFLLQNLRRDHGRDPGWRWQMNLELLGDHLPRWAPGPNSTLPPYAGPVLWLAGADSRYIGPEYAAAMRALFPRVQLVTDQGGRSLGAQRSAAGLRRDDPSIPASVAVAGYGMLGLDHSRGDLQMPAC